MRFYQVRLRTLFVLTFLCAFLAIPVFKISTQIMAKWNAQPHSTAPKNGPTIQLPVFANTAISTVVSVPEGGLVGTGGHWIKTDGTMWAGGRMVEDSKGRRPNKEGIWELPKRDGGE